MKWLYQLVFAAIPIGTIAFLAMQQLKRWSMSVDAMPPMVKRGAVAMIALILTSIGAATGVPIVCEPDVNCLTSLDQNTVEAVLKWGVGSLFALVIHAKKK